jgi:hypothetical protein
MSDGSQSKKPVDNAFQQQKLKAWQPLLTPHWVIGTFLFVGIVFLPIGGIVLKESSAVVELTARYDQRDLPNSCTKEVMADCRSGIMAQCNLCKVDVEIPITEAMEAPIFFYYKLTNFYQNHRRYVKSRNDEQLKGSTPYPSDLSSCDPLKEFQMSETDDTVASLYPCGLIANSVFNDTFTASVVSGGNTRVLTPGSAEWQQDGIAWPSDKKDKFKLRSLDEPSETGKGPGGFTIWTQDNNEDFIVWMRTAGLPTFKKLYRKIGTNLNKDDILRVSVLNVFPVSEFKGEKAIVLSTTSFLGGKNAFLGWAYIIVGTMCILLAFIFFCKHKVSPRPLGDMKYFNWPGSSKGQGK